MRKVRNNYSWPLDKDFIAHGTAHLSKNWTAQDQKEYNADYYQQHKEKWGVKGESSSKSTYSEYSENDPDFADKNFSNANNVADTDYYAFTGANGNGVIIQEDMKWELGKGQKIDKNMHRRLRAVNNIIDQRQKDGEKTTTDDFVKLTSQAIDGTLDVNEDKKARQKNALGAQGSTASAGKYLDDIYAQAEAHLKEKGIDAESDIGKAFYEKFNKLVANQAKTVNWK